MVQIVVKFTVIIDGTSLYTPALYGVFLIWGIHPLIIHFSRIFHYKPSLVGGLEYFFFSIQLGMSSSQLTHIFQP